LNAVAAPACCETLSQYETDFGQALLTPTSASITSTGNTSSDATALIQNLSTASGYPRLGVGSFAAAYGTNLAATTATAADASFPTTLGSVAVAITDSAGVTRAAPIQYVSPGQVNYLVPAGSAPGIATVTIGGASGSAQIDSVGAGLYSVGPTIAAATAALYAADGTSRPVNVFQCNPACTAVPMSVGNSSDMLVVTLYGTGFRNVASAASASLTIGGVPAQILYIGAQPTYPGLDQVNMVVPRSVAGEGEVAIVLTVNGQTANAVTLNIQ
jgi:uncharacterized protein (TIGR03437 family)